MYLEIGSVEQLKKQVLGVFSSVKKVDPSSRIFFFGSRVRGDSGKKSDIDIGYMGEPLSPAEYLEIQERLDNVLYVNTPYFVDFVDFNNSRSTFREEALRYSEIL